VSHNPQAMGFNQMEKLIDSVLVRDTTRALFYLDKITEAAPYFTEGYVQKFKIHLARSEWKSIENSITKAVRNSRKEASKFNYSYLLTVQAMTYVRLRHEEDALQVFDEAIKFDKGNATAYFERAKLWLSLGKASKARSDFKKAFLLGDKRAGQMVEIMPE
jgi:tetratricopeptide (TPR) repeat protein